MAFGKKGRMTFCILPGNPKAVRTCYDVFVRRILLRLAGRIHVTKELDLTVPEEIRKTEDVSTLTPALLQTSVSGLQELNPREPNAFVVMDKNSRNLPRGSTVRVIVP
jgi:molybdopterin biosynthesis enzyme